MPKTPAKPSGAKRAKYRREVEARLAIMGYKPSRLRWQLNPGRLTVIVGDEMRDFALHAGQSKAKTEYELGRLDTWAEVLHLKPLPAPLPPAVRKLANGEQIDMMDLIAATPAKPNGAVSHGVSR